MTEGEEQAHEPIREAGREGEETRGVAPEGESVDQLGIPMSREPTIDDVRGDGEAHRRLALGCTLLVMALLAAFYLVRGGLLGRR